MIGTFSTHGYEEKGVIGFGAKLKEKIPLVKSRCKTGR